MSDVFTRTKRSEVMARIRSRGNATTEHALINIFRRSKVTGWRRHQKVMGRPDFVFRKGRIAVFVDGCFWHGCPKCYQPPRQNKDFWKSKLIANRSRDRKVNASLRKAGWTVIRFWEHDLRKSDVVDRRIVGLFAASSKADAKIAR